MPSTVSSHQSFPRKDQLDQTTDPKERLKLQQTLVRDFILMDVRHAGFLLADILKYSLVYPDPKLSLFYEFHKAFVENQVYNYQLAEKHYRNALTIAKELDDTRWLIKILVEYAALKINEHLIEEATQMLDECVSLLEEYPDNALKARVQIRHGFLYLNLASYESAIEAFLDAKSLLEFEPDGLSKYFFQVYMYSGLGLVYDADGNPEMFLQYSRLANKLCEKHQLHATRRAWYFLILGNAYKANNNLRAAAKYYRAVNRINDDYSILARAGATANLGSIAFKQWDIKTARRLYDRASDLYHQKNPEDYRNFAQIEMWLSELAQVEGRIEDQEKHLVKAYLYSIKEIHNYNQAANFSTALATFYKTQQRYREAYEFLEISKELDHKYHIHHSNNRIQDLELRYELEKNRKEAQLYQLQVETLQQRALRAQMNPHFLFNALNSIQSFTLQGDKKQASKYLEKFAKLMRKSLYNSEMDYIPLDEEVAFLKQYLDLNAILRFDGNLQYEIHIDSDVEDDILDVPTMIIQPYVENSIEHGLRPKGSGKVDITYKMRGDDLICVIEDNGIGLRAAEELKKPDLDNHRSRGTAITEKRLQILHKDFDRNFVETEEIIEHTTGQTMGTKVTIVIPIQYTN